MECRISNCTFRCPKCGKEQLATYDPTTCDTVASQLFYEDQQCSCGAGTITPKVQMRIQCPCCGSFFGRPYCFGTGAYSYRVREARVISLRGFVNGCTHGNN